MAKILSGKEVNDYLLAGLAGRTAALEKRGIRPALCIIRIGDRPDDMSYERSAVKKCGKLHIACESRVFPANVSQQTLLEEIRRLNRDDDIHGVLLLRPLPGHLEASVIENELIPAKDVDGMTDLSMAGVFSGRPLGFPPCTPQACMEVLDYYGIDCTGRRAVVVGRSLVTGRPAAMLLMRKNATVTVCHTRTADLEQVTREADILLVAAGKAGMISAGHVRKGQIVLDVGIHVDENGRLRGDVNEEEVLPVVAALTPVPGGIGPVTTTVLAENVIRAAEATLME